MKVSPSAFPAMEITVAGYSLSGNGPEAFRWTLQDGMIGLGDLSGGGFESVAYKVSGNGNVIVGRGTSALGTEAFRWSQATGMVGLGFLPGGTFSQAQSVSADGNVIVGIARTSVGDEAFVWTPSAGMRSLNDFLAGAGVSLNGLTSFTGALEISDDGTTIVGEGRRSDGLREAVLLRDSNRFGATIVPEASTGALMGGTMLILCGLVAAYRRVKS